MNEKPKTERKLWQKPELTVLVRSEPGEAVLTACKIDTSGPSNSAGTCYSGAPGSCTGCASFVGS